MDAGQAPGAYRFDRFTLDLGRGALLGPGGAEIPLRPKSFALLRLLVENAGRLLDRDAIMAAVWPDVIVTDESITQCARDIRKALGDEAQRVLRTAPKRGYLFAAHSSAEAAMAAQRAARRLAAIVAAGVVGHARLIQTDEAGTLRRLTAHCKELVEPLVTKHRGRVAKLPSDGVLCEFASVVDAVTCAVAIQRGMAERESAVTEVERIRFRIGVNLGDIVCEADGDIWSDCVNIATQLEALSPPGGIGVLAAVRELLIGNLAKLCFVDLGEQLLKASDRPLRVLTMKPPFFTAPAPAVIAVSPLRPSISVLPFAKQKDHPEWSCTANRPEETAQTAQASRMSQALLGAEHQIQLSKLAAGIDSSRVSGQLDDLSRLLDALLVRLDGALTQRSEALDRLAASEARYEALVNTQGGFIARMTPDLRLSFVSDAYCRYYQQNREELLGRGFNEFTLTVLEDCKRHTAHLSALTPEHPTHAIELRCRLQDGSIRWVEWTDTALFDGEGRLVEVQSVGRDITERRTSGLAQRGTQMEVFMLPCGRVTFVNEAYCQHVRKPRRYLLSEAFNGLDLMAPEDRPNFEEHLRKLTPEQPVAAMEARAILPDGSERREYWVDRGIFGRDGRLVALQSAGRDVTDRLGL